MKLLIPTTNKSAPNHNTMHQPMVSTQSITMAKCQTTNTWHQRANTRSKLKWQQNWPTYNSNMLWCWSSRSSSIGRWSSCTTLRHRWMPRLMTSRCNTCRCKKENVHRISCSGSSCKPTQGVTARESSIPSVSRFKSRNYEEMSLMRSFLRSREQLKARVSMDRLIQRQ